MRFLIFFLSGLIVVSISGCGSFWAGVVHGPTCPYQGVQFDFKMATNWDAIKGTYGFVIPLAVVDLPFSFVVDTFTLGQADGGDRCPRKFES
jgi:uncharacterized protein YceK